MSKQQNANPHKQSVGVLFGFALRRKIVIIRMVCLEVVFLSAKNKKENKKHTQNPFFRSMSHFGTLFSQGATKRVTPAQRLQKLRSKLDRRLHWFLDHNQWSLALNLVRTHSAIQGNVVTPHHYKQIVAASSGSSRDLLDFVRSSCAADEIPNSPGLYAD